MHVPAVARNRSRTKDVRVVVRLRGLLGYLALVVCTVTSCTSTPPPLPASSLPSQVAASPVSTLTPPGRSVIPATPSGVALRAFDLRMGAVDPLTASLHPSDGTYERVRLAAGAGTVTIRFSNARPQSITVVDDATGSDLYHVSSRFGPGNPQVDQGFVQFFFAPLHADGSEQLVLAYGQCQPACSGAAQILVISMNAEHGVVTEQLRLDSLTNAVAEAREDGLWITEWGANTLLSTRHLVWADSEQIFTER